MNRSAIIIHGDSELFWDIEVTPEDEDEMIGKIRARGRPVILMGDMNCRGRSAWSSVRRLCRALDLRPARSGATFPIWRPRSRLDWILASSSLEIRRFEAIRHEVSDHVALTAELAWA